MSWSQIPDGAEQSTLLVPHLEEYIADYRARLYQRQGGWSSDPGQSLWLSLDGSALTVSAIDDRLAARTKTAFGFEMRAHAFRHAAVTTLATERPEHIEPALPSWVTQRRIQPNESTT
jgi:hypothetical protein